jgi:hypothetical protein
MRYQFLLSPDINKSVVFVNDSAKVMRADEARAGREVLEFSTRDTNDFGGPLRITTGGENPKLFATGCLSSPQTDGSSLTQVSHARVSALGAGVLTVPRQSKIQMKRPADRPRTTKTPRQKPTWWVESAERG